MPVVFQQGIADEVEPAFHIGQLFRPDSGKGLVEFALAFRLVPFRQQPLKDHVVLAGSDERPGRTEPVAVAAVTGIPRKRSRAYLDSRLGQQARLVAFLERIAYDAVEIQEQPVRKVFAASRLEVSV